MRIAGLTLLMSIALASFAFGQTTSPVHVSEAIARAIDATHVDVNADSSKNPIDRAAGLRERGRREKIVGYHLLVIGAIAGPNMLDFIIPGKYRLATWGMSLAAIGGLIAAIGHRHWNAGNNEIIRMLTRVAASW